MNSLQINQYHFSQCFWNIVFEKAEHYSKATWPRILEDLIETERLREFAEFNTGSVSLSTAFTLGALVDYFKPKTIAEVGTFIGKSTLAFASAMDPGGKLFTCDISNDIPLPFASKLGVTQYRKKVQRKCFLQLSPMANLSIWWRLMGA